jgi:2-isopropylmalate synthase
MVEAACRALRKDTQNDGRLTHYSATSVTGGVDALADLALRFEVDGLAVPGRGLSTDVVEASARAFLNAINRILRVRESGEDPSAVDRPGSLRGV